MAGANSNIQMTDLDFNKIKTNLKTFLQSQDSLKDYNYEGSALSVLLDILAYNTQYNAYYLNMVANEMFLDTALKRNSVVSHAKLMGYTPKSSIAPTATVTLEVFDVTGDTSLTLPKFTRFISEPINGVNYNFLTDEIHTVNVVNNVASFNNIDIKQGVASRQTFTYDSTQNPKSYFEIPDSNIDTTSLEVVVQQSSSNTAQETYTLSVDYLTLDSESTVYFLQEGLDEKYEIYFGDGVLGKKLTDGNIIYVSYIRTSGTKASGANNFTLMNTVGGYSNTALTPIYSATKGGNKESIDSIKFQAPKSYSSQNRAVTKEDYITVLQQNKIGVSFDAVNVWGGEENYDPVYGQVFICLKPSGAYLLTDTQKERLITEVIKPQSVMTVVPTIVDPDYTYIDVTSTVLYDQKKTTLTSRQIENKVKTTISNYSANNLNTFNSTFALSDLIQDVQATDNSIVANDISIKVGKKFYPQLKTAQTYNLYFNTPLEKGSVLTGVSSYPDLTFRDPTTPTRTISGVYIEEVPSDTSGVDQIHILNPGFGYTVPPTVTIVGDGTGATAEAKINNKGSISSITITDPGQNYTSAIVKITAAEGDTTGQLAAATVIMIGQYGTLRTYYYNDQSVKTILNSDAGTIDYVNGIITLNSFNPVDVNNPLGQLGIFAKPKSTIISSTYSGIITIDPYDPASITVNVSVK